MLLGAIFAAAMSTLSSSLNSCATAAVRDLHRPWPDGRDCRHAGAALTRGADVRVRRRSRSAVGIGGQWLESSVVSSVLGIAAFTTGIVLGVFFLGMLRAPRRRSARRSPVSSSDLASMTAIYFATPLAWPWYALVGSAITFLAGLAASHAWPRQVPAAI